MGLSMPVITLMPASLPACGLLSSSLPCGPSHRASCWCRVHWFCSVTFQMLIAVWAAGTLITQKGSLSAGYHTTSLICRDDESWWAGAPSCWLPSPRPQPLLCPASPLPTLHLTSLSGQNFTFLSSVHLEFSPLPSSLAVFEHSSSTPFSASYLPPCPQNHPACPGPA